MLPVREFTSAADLMAHNRRVAQMRFAPLKPVAAPIKPIAPPVITLPVANPEPEIVHLAPEEYARIAQMIAAYRATKGNRCSPAPSDVPRALLSKTILRTVALEAGLCVGDLKGQSRVLHIAQARQAAMWLVNRYTIRSFPEIGNMFGHRDHTTALHAVKKVNRLIEANGWTVPLDTPQDWASVLLAHSWSWSGGPVGEGNGNCRLSDAAVLAIRSEHKAGATCASLSRKYGVTPHHVSGIVRHKSRTLAEREIQASLLAKESACA